MLPDFIIIGAMKGGTTSLYHYIASHPKIVSSSKKETNFFTTTDNFNNGIEWYQSLFRGNGKYAFEASPNYTKRHTCPGVPQRMHSVLPAVKLIYVLRDPIDRILSHYVHNYAYGRESQSFSDAIRIDSNYIQTSQYYFQIEAFLQYYSSEQLLLVESEQLRKDPNKTLQDIFEFLTIPPEYDTALLEQRFHESSAKKRATSLERIVVEKTTNRYLQAIVRRMTAPLKKTIERPRLSQTDKEMLITELSPDIERLRQFSGLKFSNWSL